MSNNLNWAGNKVFNANATPRQPPRSAYDASPQLNMRHGAPDPPPVHAPGTAGSAGAPSAAGITENPAPSVPGTAAGASPGTAAAPAVPFQQGFPPATEKGYIPYYLASNIGKNVRAEFIIGSNQYSDKTGRLIEVGINYFVLEDTNSRTHIMCDMYSVKFVIVLQDSTRPFF